MRIIRNNIIPFEGYIAINLFGILFVREEVIIDAETLNHESIHTAQMKEMLYIPYYIWYVIEWILKVLFYFNTHRAYRSIGFEREAYLHESDLKYLDSRKHYTWFKHIINI